MVTIAPFASTIAEPANFYECTANVTLSQAQGASYVSGSLLWSQIMALLPSLPGTTTSLQKFRVSSMVVEPVYLTMVNPSTTGASVAAELVPLELDFGVSGMHVIQSDRNKPIRKKFSKLFGTDGMWNRQTGSGTYVTDQFSQTFVTFSAKTAPIMGSTGTQANVYGGIVDVKLRLVWTDNDLM